MRADRLLSALLLLQSRGRVTAAQLADELEVSVPTARRDLEALSAAGVPVYPQAGRGGGWQLVGGARTDLSGLTADETQALFLLLGPAATSRPEARSALAKLVRALPSTFRADAEAAAAAVTDDPTAWGEVGAVAPVHLAALQATVVSRSVVRLRYRSRSDGSVERVVEPHRLVRKGPTWYLLAETSGGPRTFRVDRVEALEPTGDSFVAPPRDEVDAAWERTVDVVEHARSHVTATVRVPTEVLDVVRGHFGTYLEVVEPGERTTVVRVGAHLAVSLAEQLAGWGDRVEVLDPPEVRDALRQIGERLAALYT